MELILAVIIGLGQVTAVGGASGSATAADAGETSAERARAASGADGFETESAGMQANIQFIQLQQP